VINYGDREDLRPFVEAAAAAARFSPCQKSKRGVAIWRAGQSVEHVRHVGFNHPPHGFHCDGSEACRAACNKVCVHAETHVLLQAGTWAQGMEMLHVKVVDDEPVHSGVPSCWQCSRNVVQAGISGFWLLHEDGPRRYTASEFHELTLAHCDLPAVR
jgi:deoxycytidylate deaminase